MYVKIAVDVEVPMEVLDLERCRFAGIVAATEEVADHPIHHLVAFLHAEVVGRTRLDLALLGDERLVSLELLGQASSVAAATAACRWASHAAITLSDGTQV